LDVADTSSSELADGSISSSSPRSRSYSHSSGRQDVIVSPPNIMQRRGSTGRYSPGTVAGRMSLSSSKLLGSYEESLLSGRMPSAPASSVKGFMLDIGACGRGMCPSHVKLPFEAAFYHFPGESLASPYVGVVNLEQAMQRGTAPGRYRVPASGLVQVIVSNPQKTGVKVFIVRYDFSDMPPESKTFLRQRTYTQVANHTPGNSKSPPGGRLRNVLKYAIHLRFMSSKRGHIYLCKDVRVVFAHRAPDEEERISTVTEGPSPVFTPQTGASPSLADGALYRRSASLSSKTSRLSLSPRAFDRKNSLSSGSSHPSSGNTIDQDVCALEQKLMVS
jgi:hypothetical protein